MTEQLKNQMDVIDLISSMIEFKNPANLSLGVTLQRMGYEIQPERSKDGIIVRFHASYEFTVPRLVPTISLIFTKDGILHAPKDDLSLEIEHPRKARLKSIFADPNTNEIKFSFEGVSDNTEKMSITLSTKYEREILGKI